MIRKIISTVIVFTMILSLFPGSSCYAAEDTEVYEKLSEAQMEQIFGAGRKKTNLKGYVWVNKGITREISPVQGAIVSSCNNKSAKSNYRGYYYLKNVQSGGTTCNYVMARYGNMYSAVTCREIKKCKKKRNYWKKGTHTVNIEM